MTSSEALPRFGKPPVVETVLGIHFRPLEKFTSAYQGVLWDRFFRVQFPRLEEKAPVEEQHERFGEERIAFAGPTFRWQVMDRPEAPRLWAASESGEHVVQIQKNALFANWQKRAESSTYRPFSKRRQEFVQQLGHLEQFMKELDIGRVEPTSWVVTYINHIEYEEVLNIGPTTASVFTVWTNQTSDNWLPLPDKIAMEMAYPLPENVGRLHVTSTPVIRLNDKKEMVRIDLTARGKVKTRDMASVLQGIDMGHEWVVRGFVSLTRPEMHKVWERLQ
jgi:uncharacterized protein (TIGR04255 family)